MKVTITTREPDSELTRSETLRTIRVGDWTFRQADMVRALTTSPRHPEGIGPGDVFSLLIKDDEKAALAFAIVAYMVAGRDPGELPDMTVEGIVLDLTDTEQEPEDGPPAEGAGDEIAVGANSNPTS